MSQRFSRSLPGRALLTTLAVALVVTLVLIPQQAFAGTWTGRPVLSAPLTTPNLASDPATWGVPGKAVSSDYATGAVEAGALTKANVPGEYNASTMEALGNTYRGSDYTVYAARDASYVYIGVKVKDVAVMGCEPTLRRDRSDYVEFYVERDNTSSRDYLREPKPGAPNGAPYTGSDWQNQPGLFYAGINPADCSSVPAPEWRSFNNLLTHSPWVTQPDTTANPPNNWLMADNNEGTQVGWASARGTWSGGFWVNIKISLSALGQTGNSIGFDVVVKDRDAAGSDNDNNRTWFAAQFENWAYAGGDMTSVLNDSMNWGEIALSTQSNLGFGTSAVEFCAPLTVDVNLTGVTNLYGYQFKVLYGSAKVNATGTFHTSFFDVDGDGAVPPGWGGACVDGTCQFAKTELAPDGPVSGSGTVAKMTLTPRASGSFTLNFSGDILSDRDAVPLPHSLGTLDLTVKCTAQAYGVVQLQGRATPIDAGTVTLTDLGTTPFPPVTVNFNAITGAWTAGPFEVQPSPTGSTYQLDAAHGLYLGNRTTTLLVPGANYNTGTTKLRGGDANNNGTIEIFDLTCIGGSFGDAPVTCGTTGSSDINADGTVNILDLVLPGGNYGLFTPQVW